MAGAARRLDPDHPQGKPATILRGIKAVDFVVDVESGNPQELMARLTGNYKHGNERMARHHPRNR